MELSERKKKILKVIVENYIETAEPVGSKTIAQSSDLGLSSATIRNEMAELTAMGYLEQPHTSAGRVPSPSGYRIFVNELMISQRLSLEETQEINRALNSKIKQLDALIADAGNFITELTNYPAYALAAAAHKATIKRFDFIFVDANTVIAVAMLDNNTVKNKLMHFPAGISENFVKKLATVFNANFTGITEDAIDERLISSAERGAGDTGGAVAAVAGFAINSLIEAVPKKAYIAGTSHILDHPEYRDLDKAQKLLSYLSDGERLLALPKPEDDSEVKILIGPENVADELHDSSVVVASYDLGNDVHGLLGVVGPTRMDYAKVAARLSYISQGLKALMSGEEIPPPKRFGSGGKD